MARLARRKTPLCQVVTTPGIGSFASRARYGALGHPVCSSLAHRFLGISFAPFPFDLLTAFWYHDIC